MVRLHALILDPTLDIFVLFTRRKRVAGIVLYVCLKVALSVAFPWLSGAPARGYVSVCRRAGGSG